MAEVLEIQTLVVVVVVAAEVVEQLIQTPEDQQHNQELTHLHLLQTMVLLAVVVETQVIMPAVEAVVALVRLDLVHQHPILADLVVMDNHSQHLHIHSFLQLFHLHWHQMVHQLVLPDGMVLVVEEEMAPRIFQTHLVDPVAEVKGAAPCPVLDLVVLAALVLISAAVAAEAAVVVTAVLVAMVVQVAVVLLFSEEQLLKE